MEDSFIVTAYCLEREEIGWQFLCNILCKRYQFFYSWGESLSMIAEPFNCLSSLELEKLVWTSIGCDYSVVVKCYYLFYYNVSLFYLCRMINFQIIAKTFLLMVLSAFSISRVLRNCHSAAPMKLLDQQEKMLIWLFIVDGPRVLFLPFSCHDSRHLLAIGLEKCAWAKVKSEIISLHL